MKIKVLIICVIICATDLTAQNNMNNFIENLNKIYRHNDLYYVRKCNDTNHKTNNVWNFFVFDSLSIKHTQLTFSDQETKLVFPNFEAKIIQKYNATQSFSNNWFIANDSLYILYNSKKESNTTRITIPNAEFNPFISFDIFSFFNKQDNVSNEGKHVFNEDLPLKNIPEFSEEMPRYENNENQTSDIVNIYEHKWFDMIFSEKYCIIIATINDTILAIKDIELDSISKVCYSIRGQMYHSEKIKFFKTFRVNQNLYLVNDAGEVFVIPEEKKRTFPIEYIVRDENINRKKTQMITAREDRVPEQIGYFLYENEQNPFYLIDKDNEKIYFNCKFVSLSEEYRDVIGYIDSENWLYKKYTAIISRK